MFQCRSPRDARVAEGNRGAASAAWPEGRRKLKVESPWQSHWCCLRARGGRVWSGREFAPYEPRRRSRCRASSVSGNEMTKKIAIPREDLERVRLEGRISQPLHLTVAGLQHLRYADPRCDRRVLDHVREQRGQW